MKNPPQFLAKSQSSSGLNIPASEATVDVRVIDTKTELRINPDLFLQSQSDAQLQGFDAPIYCFLVTHGSHHVLFDLGVRCDWENYAPRIVSLIKATTTIKPGADVAQVLDDDASGLQVHAKDVEAIIWSHNHFDHIGDPSTFPSSTDLVVGPGLKDASWPGWPTVSEAGVRNSDAADRTVREINFDGDGAVTVGRFAGFDYFGDGSFYLLEAPGHATGHMCGLARVNASPEPAFVFMGADACHHPGVLRPSLHLPLPPSINLPPGLGYCPGDLLQHITVNGGTEKSFFTLPRNMLFPDHEAALDTVRKIQELDANDEVFVIISHDASIRDSLPLFPESVNDWRTKGLKTTTRWWFCGGMEMASVSSSAA
ncbi:metallo-beta-lactamase superfamily protein [Seiridium cupressi]